MWFSIYNKLIGLIIIGFLPRDLRYCPSIKKCSIKCCKTSIFSLVVPADVLKICFFSFLSTCVHEHFTVAVMVAEAYYPRPYFLSDQISSVIEDVSKESCSAFDAWDCLNYIRKQMMFLLVTTYLPHIDEIQGGKLTDSPSICSKILLFKSSFPLLCQMCMICTNSL